MVFLCFLYTEPLKSPIYRKKREHCRQDNNCHSYRNPNLGLPERIFRLSTATFSPEIAPYSGNNHTSANQHKGQLKNQEGWNKISSKGPYAVHSFIMHHQKKMAPQIPAAFSRPKSNSPVPISLPSFFARINTARSLLIPPSREIGTICVLAVSSFPSSTG